MNKNKLIYQKMLDYQHLKQIVIAILLCSLTAAEDNPIPKLQYHTMQVFGNSSLGYYYTNIYIGTPPQPQSVIIDTASNRLAVPCSICSTCSRNHIHPLFNISLSSTCKTITCASKKKLCQDSCQGDVPQTKHCQFDIFYAQGSSLKGVYLQDMVQLQKNSVGESAKLFFGCTTNETQKFMNQKANGILGLAPSGNYLIDSFHEQHYINTNEKKQIAICLSRNGGGLFIGGYLKELTNSQVEPIKGTISNIKNFYSLNSFTDGLAGNQLFHQGKNYENLNVFIDSGSTYTYLPDESYNKLLKVIDYICESHIHCNIASLTENYDDPQRCYQFSHMMPTNPTRAQFQETIDNMFPLIFFQISGIPIEWKPTQYFLLRDIENKQICLGIGALENSLILGANWMVNKNIVFDIENLNFVIYPQVNCAYPDPNLIKQNINQEYQPKMGLLLEKQTGNKPLFHESKSVFVPISALIKIFSVILTFIIIVAVLTLVLRKKADNKNLQEIQQNSTTSIMEEQQEQHSEISVFKNKPNSEE